MHLTRTFLPRRSLRMTSIMIVSRSVNVAIARTLERWVPAEIRQYIRRGLAGSESLCNQDIIEGKLYEVSAVWHGPAEVIMSCISHWLRPIRTQLPMDMQQ